MLPEYLLHNWPSAKAGVQELQLYWSLRHERAITDGIAMKCGRIIIPASLQNKVLNQLHLSHMV